MDSTAHKEKQTLTDLMRIRFKGILDPAAGFLNRLGLRPNTVTFLGLVGNTFGAYLLAVGQITWGGVVVLLAGPIDALDGAMARLRGESTRFGAFIDSVTDRYSELMIYAGLMIHFIRQENWLACALVYLAAAGSVLVSYVKARAEALGFEAKIGLLTRMERYLVLAPMLVINRPEIALWIIAVLANFTAIQRILYVRHQARSGFDAQGKQRYK